MELATANEVCLLLRGYLASTALGAAVELDLFWMLTDQPRTVEEVAQRLSKRVKRSWRTTHCRRGSPTVALTLAGTNSRPGFTRPWSAIHGLVAT